MPRFPNELLTAIDTPHPVVERPHLCEIVGLCWHSLLATSYATVIGLLIKQQDSLRLLRFRHTQGLEVEEGGPTFTGGFAIYDVSRRGLERIGVRVTDLEASGGKVSFWAHRVEELPVSEFGRHEALVL